jgi:hypothetical protein
VDYWLHWKHWGAGLVIHPPRTEDVQIAGVLTRPAGCSETRHDRVIWDTIAVARQLHPFTHSHASDGSAAVYPRSPPADPTPQTQPQRAQRGVWVWGWVHQCAAARHHAAGRRGRVPRVRQAAHPRRRRRAAANDSGRHAGELREREDLVGLHGRWKRPCLQTAHMTI